MWSTNRAANFQGKERNFTLHVSKNVSSKRTKPKKKARNFTEHVSFAFPRWSITILTWHFTNHVSNKREFHPNLWLTIHLFRQKRLLAIAMWNNVPQQSSESRSTHYTHVVCGSVQSYMDLLDKNAQPILTLRPWIYIHWRHGQCRTILLHHDNMIRIG